MQKGAERLPEIYGLVLQMIASAKGSFRPTVHVSGSMEQSSCVVESVWPSGDGVSLISAFRSAITPPFMTTTIPTKAPILAGRFQFFCGRK